MKGERRKRMNFLLVPVAALYAYVIGELIRGWPRHPDSRCYTGLTNRDWEKHQERCGR
jgi:hypothetical protein